MIVKFLGFDRWQGKINIGSSLIRIDDVIKHWPEASRYKHGDDCDVMIYQKAYWLEHARAFNGIKILDVCDPDFMEMQSRFMEMVQEVDAITTSSPELTEFLKKMTKKPVVYIPDRINIETHREKKEHIGRAKRVVWFGYSTNFPALDSAIKAIIDARLELIVISNQPYRAPKTFAMELDLTNIQWTPKTVNEDIIKGDVVINPRLSTTRFKFKSNNKTLKAWALGVPVASTDKELKLFMDETTRKEEAKKRYAEILEKWDSKQSVDEYKNLIEQIKCNEYKNLIEQIKCNKK